MQKYDDNSIGKLEGAERVRFRPATMLGSNGIDGARHTIYEIVGNASDEQLAGFGEDIRIRMYDDGSISVRDYGRGVPLGWNEKVQDWNYFLIYEELYAGGKYGNSQEILRKFQEAGNWDDFNIKDYPYIITVGLNGLGAAATQCTSEYCTVSSFRDGVKRTMKYEKGNHVLDALIEEKTDEPNGTFVHWKPDSEVFTDVKLNASKWVAKMCKNLSYTADFNVYYTDEDGEEHFYPKKTLLEHLQDEVDDAVYSELFTHEVDLDGDVCICFADVAVGVGGIGNSFFHNKVGVQGGVHADAVNCAEWTFFYTKALEHGVKIKASDYSGKLSVIVSTLSNKVSYRGQTKDSLDNGYVQRCIEQCMLNVLELEYSKGTKWLLDAVDSVVETAQNRIAVAELSKSFKEVEKAIKSTKVSHKFKTCDAYESKNYDQVEFWLFEGNSAGDAGKAARDSRYQALLPFRGKSLNVFKATIQQIVANTEIKDIIAALGCGVDMGIEGYESFNMSKLRVGKIIFGADADIDGDHINMLLFLIFYKLFPELLYEGKVYIANCPLYVIIGNDDTHYYCMDEDEMRKKTAELGTYKDIIRCKGLGEMNSDQLWDTVMNPETRHLTQIKLDRNDMSVYDVLEVYFGKSTDRRKEVILGSMLGDEYISTMESIEDIIEEINSSDLSNLVTEEVVLE